jgi:hypothetical protein
MPVGDELLQPRRRLGDGVGGGDPDEVKTLGEGIVDQRRLQDGRAQKSRSP